MAGYMRLQETLSITENQAQEREYAADVGRYNSVAVQVQVLATDSTGQLQLQHAAVNEESAYRDVGNSVSLNSTTGAVQTLTSPLRYLRWSVNSLSTGATFLVDLVAREN